MGLLVVCLGVRVWGVRQGLPFVYNVDEESHFVPKALTFFGHDLDPNYFLNPPAYSYLLNVVFECWFGGRDAVMRAYASDPSEVFVLARVVAGVLGTVAVWLTYLTGGRLFSRGVGLLAAAIFGLAFLPVFYSHLALNDVPTLAPVCLSLYAIAGILTRGGWRDYLLAGVGVGLAAATKYTGGYTLLCLLGAFAFDLLGSTHRRVPRRLLAALIVGLVAFVAANPYALINFHAFWEGVRQQASEADAAKLGSSPVGGIRYYLWTFTWGLGWAPALAALAGAILLLLRRKVWVWLVLVPAPVLFIVFMGEQARYFGRWLMPVFPIAALLAAYAACALAGVLSRALPRRVPATLPAMLIAVLLLAQSLTAVLHNDQVLSRPDTLNTTRAWMIKHIPAGAKIVIEPMIPTNWTYTPAHPNPETPSGERWTTFNTAYTNITPNYQPLPQGQRRLVAPDQYESTLRPHLLHEYQANDYCYIITGSLQAGRADIKPKQPQAIAYYTALTKQATLIYHITPYTPHTTPIPFNFDWSIDYYPRQYHLPGPEINIYQLHQDKCRSAT